MIDGGLKVTPPVPSVPLRLRPMTGFDIACTQVLEHLQRTAPMGMWAVSRVVHDTEVMLAVDAPEFAIRAGDEFPFNQTLCRRMCTGAAQQIAPAVRSVPAYRDAVAWCDSQGIEVNAYVGAPIVRPDGELFGTLCAVSGQEQPESLLQLQPLSGILSRTTLTARGGLSSSTVSLSKSNRTVTERLAF